MSKRGNGYGGENRVNILKKVKVGKNWNLFPAVVEPNGRLRDKVRVRRKVELHLEGHYYLEWWQDGRKREQIKERTEVLARARRKAIELQANRAGIETVQPDQADKGFTVAEAVALYLKDIEPPQREPKTYGAYKHCLELFARNCSEKYIRDVKRQSPGLHSQALRVGLWAAHRLQPRGHSCLGLLWVSRFKSGFSNVRNRL